MATVQHRGITVTYDGIVAGEFTVDLLVEEILQVQLKAVTALNDGGCPPAPTQVLQGLLYLARDMNGSTR